jgi:hypothetical protein
LQVLLLQKAKQTTLRDQQQQQQAITPINQYRSIKAVQSQGKALGLA